MTITSMAEQKTSRCCGECRQSQDPEAVANSISRSGIIVSNWEFLLTEKHGGLPFEPVKAGSHSSAVPRIVSRTRLLFRTPQVSCRRAAIPQRLFPRPAPNCSPHQEKPSVKAFIALRIRKWLRTLAHPSCLTGKIKGATLAERGSYRRFTVHPLFINTASEPPLHC